MEDEPQQNNQEQQQQEEQKLEEEQQQQQQIADEEDDFLFFDDTQQQTQVQKKKKKKQKTQQQLEEQEADQKLIDIQQQIQDEIDERYLNEFDEWATQAEQDALLEKITKEVNDKYSIKKEQENIFKVSEPDKKTVITENKKKLVLEDESQNAVNLIGRQFMAIEKPNWFNKLKGAVIVTLEQNGDIKDMLINADPVNAFEEIIYNAIDVYKDFLIFIEPETDQLYKLIIILPESVFKIFVDLDEYNREKQKFLMSYKTTNQEQRQRVGQIIFNQPNARDIVEKAYQLNIRFDQSRKIQGKKFEQKLEEEWMQRQLKQFQTKEEQVNRQSKDYLLDSRQKFARNYPVLQEILVYRELYSQNFQFIFRYDGQELYENMYNFILFATFPMKQAEMTIKRDQIRLGADYEQRRLADFAFLLTGEQNYRRTISDFVIQCKVFVTKVREIFLKFDSEDWSQNLENEQARSMKNYSLFFAEGLQNLFDPIINNLRKSMNDRKLIQSQWQQQVIDYQRINSLEVDRIRLQDFFAQRHTEQPDIADELLNLFREDFMQYQKYLNPHFKQANEITSIYGQMLSVFAHQNRDKQTKLLFNYFRFADARLDLNPLEQWPVILNTVNYGIGRKDQFQQIPSQGRFQKKTKYNTTADNFALSFFTSLPQYQLCWLVFILRLLADGYIQEIQEDDRKYISQIFFPRVNTRKIYLRGGERNDELFNLSDIGEDAGVLRQEGDAILVDEYYSYVSCLYLISSALQLSLSKKQGVFSTEVDIQKFKMIRYNVDNELPFEFTRKLVPIINKLTRENSQEKMKEAKNDPQEIFYIATKKSQPCLGLIQLHAEKNNPQYNNLVFKKNNISDTDFHPGDQFNIQGIANEIVHTVSLLIKFLVSLTKEAVRYQNIYYDRKLKFTKQFEGAYDVFNLKGRVINGVNVQLVFQVQQLLQQSQFFPEFADDTNHVKTKVLSSPVIVYFKNIKFSDKIVDDDFFIFESRNLVLLFANLIFEIIERITINDEELIRQAYHMTPNDIFTTSIRDRGILNKIFDEIYGQTMDSFLNDYQAYFRPRRSARQIGLYQEVSFYFSMNEFRRQMIAEYVQSNPQFDKGWERVLKQCLKQQADHSTNLNDEEKEDYPLYESDAIMETVNGKVNVDQNVKILSLLGIRIPRILFQVFDPNSDSAWEAAKQLLSRINNYRMVIVYNNFILNEMVRNVGSVQAQNIYVNATSLLQYTNERENLPKETTVTDKKYKNNLKFLDITAALYGEDRQQEVIANRRQIISNLRNLYTPIYRRDDELYKKFYGKEFWPNYMLSRSHQYNRIIEQLSPHFDCIHHIYFWIVVTAIDSVGGMNICLNINITRDNFFFHLLDQTEKKFNLKIKQIVELHIDILQRNQFALIACINEFSQSSMKLLRKQQEEFSTVNIEFTAFFPDSINYFRQTIQIIAHSARVISIIGFRCHLEVVEGRENIDFISNKAKLWLKQQYPLSTKIKQQTYLAYKNIVDKKKRYQQIFKDRNSLYLNRLKQVENTIFCFYDLETTSTENALDTMTPYLVVFTFHAVQPHLQQMINQIETLLEFSDIPFRFHRLDQGQKRSKFFFIEKSPENPSIQVQFINILDTVLQLCCEKNVKILVTAHNGSRFDLVILLKEIFRKWKEEVNLMGSYTYAKIVKVGENMRFVDSLLMSQLGSLNSGCGPKGLNLNLQKFDNEDIKLISTLEEYFDKSEDDRIKILEYCIQDVYMLMRMITEFNFLIHKTAVKIYNKIFEGSEDDIYFISDNEEELRQKLIIFDTLPATAFFLSCELCIGKEFLLAHLDSSNFISYTLLKNQYFGGFTQVFNYSKFDHALYWDFNSKYPDEVRDIMPPGFRNDIVMISENRIQNLLDINPHSLYIVSWYKIDDTPENRQLGLFLHRDDKTFLGGINLNDCGTFQLMEFGDQNSRFTQEQLHQIILGSCKNKTMEQASLKILYGIEISVARQIIKGFRCNIIAVNQALPQEKYDQQTILYKPFKDSVESLYQLRVQAKRDQQSGLDKVIKLIINGMYGCMAQKQNDTKKVFSLPEDGEADELTIQQKYSYIQASIEKVFQEAEANQLRIKNTVDSMVQYKESRDIFQAYLAGNFKINKIDEIGMLEVKIPHALTPSARKQLSIHFASFVTTMARLHLLSTMYKIVQVGRTIQPNIPYQTQILYGDTDSIVFYILEKDVEQFLKIIDGKTVFQVKYGPVQYERKIVLNKDILGCLKDENEGDKIIEFQAYQKKLYRYNTLKKPQQQLKMKGIQQKHAEEAQQKINQTIQNQDDNFSIFQKLFSRKSMDKIYIENRQYKISLKKRQMCDENGKRIVFKNIQQKRQFCKENLQ